MNIKVCCSHFGQKSVSLVGSSSVKHGTCIVENWNMKNKFQQGLRWLWNPPGGVSTLPEERQAQDTMATHCVIFELLRGITAISIDFPHCCNQHLVIFY